MRPGRVHSRSRLVEHQQFGFPEQRLGQSDALEKALESEADCAAVLQQIAAIRGAVNGLMSEVLEHHLRDHLGADATDASQRGRDLEEVVSVLKSYLK